MTIYTRITALATTILLSLAFITPAHAATTPIHAQRVSSVTAISTKIADKPIHVASTAKLAFTRSLVHTTPAPRRPAPAPAVVAVASSQVATVQATTYATQAPAPAPTATAYVAPQPVRQTAPVAVAVPSPSRASGVGAALVASAYSQIGIHQDCTAMVERALGSIGIVTGDIAPNDFFRFGHVVSDPQPGDIIIQPGRHVAIYVGNGMAISGGFNGFNTVLHPLSYLSGVVFVRVG